MIDTTTEPEPTDQPEPTTQPEPTAQPDTTTEPEPTDQPETRTQPEPTTTTEAVTTAQQETTTVSTDLYFESIQCLINIISMSNIASTCICVVRNDYGEHSMMK